MNLSCLDEADLQSYAMGESPRVDVTLLEDHLAICESCLQRLNRITIDANLLPSFSLPREKGSLTREDIPRTIAPSLKVGDSVGCYPLFEFIGEGAVGRVFRSRHPRLQQDVAVKILKPDRAILHIQRFLAECETIAKLNHPGVARVFDSGEENGYPFLVMELLSCVHLSTYCDRERLTIPARVRLFVHVCEAVQHAHQRGVIHRDIKPSNILVTEVDGQPIPKVIDFGIARVDHAANSERNFLTEAGMLIGTPNYMSPEQAALDGRLLDTRSDVFSLGSVLFELLVGVAPFAGNQASDSVLAVLQRVAHAPTPQLVHSLQAAKNLEETCNQRSTTYRTLQRQLRGELQWIVDKSLGKSPAERYAGADGLAADLHNYLNGAALEAAPPSNWYRARKLARRYWVATLLLTILFACMAMGTFGFFAVRRSLERESLAKREADARYEQTKEAVNRFFLLVAENDQLQTPRLLPVRKQLLTNALEYYRGFAESGDNQPELIEDTAVAQVRMVQILVALGEHEQAKDMVHRAFESTTALANRQGNTIERRFDRSRLFWYEATIARLENQHRDAIESLSKAIAEVDVILPETSDITSPTHTQCQSLKADCLAAQSSSYRQLRKFKEGESALLASLAIHDALSLQEPTDLKFKRSRLRARGDLGSLLFTMQRTTEAQAINVELIGEYQGLLEQEPGTIDSEIGLAKTYANLAGTFESQRDFATAAEHQEQSLLHFQRVLELDPISAVYRENVSRAHRVAAHLHAELGNITQAERELLVYVAELEKIVDGQADVGIYVKKLAKAQFELAKFYLAHDNPKAAHEKFDQAQRLYASLAPTSTEDDFPKVYSWLCLLYLRDLETQIDLRRNGLNEELSNWDAQMKHVAGLDGKLGLIDMENRYYQRLFLNIALPDRSSNAE